MHPEIFVSKYRLPDRMKGDLGNQGTASAEAPADPKTIREQGAFLSATQVLELLQNFSATATLAPRT